MPIGSVQAFVAPSPSSYYLSPMALQSVVQTLDRNRDNVLGHDELDISPQLRRQLDRNNDRIIQLFELQDGFSRNDISIRHLPYTVAEDISHLLLTDWVYSTGLGSVGQAIDHNRDGYVNPRELSVALNRGDVVLSGSYLIALNSAPPTQPPYPGYPPNGPQPYPGYPPVTGPQPYPGHPYPGYGVNAQEARSQIQGIESNKMKKDKWGNDDPSTGIFTATEANTKIKTYLEKTALVSEGMNLAEKFTLLKAQKMPKDKWGNYDPAIGSLTWEEASQMADKATRSLKINEFEPNFAQSYLTALAAERMKADKWGNDDYTTGLLTPAQCNGGIKAFLKDVVVGSRKMEQAEKLTAIRGQVMQRDKWGNYDPRTGALTPEEANALSKQVFGDYGFQRAA